MIYVYQSRHDNSFRVVKGAHTHNTEWEKATEPRTYPNVNDALNWEYDPHIKRALQDIHLDEITAARRAESLKERPAASYAEMRRRNHK